MFSAGQNIVYNSGRMHHLYALLSKISLQYKKIASKCNTVLILTFPGEVGLQNTCFRYIVFNFFSAVPNRFKYRHNACFRDIVFIFIFGLFFVWRVCITLKIIIFFHLGKRCKIYDCFLQIML